MKKNIFFSDTLYISVTDMSFMSFHRARIHGPSKRHNMIIDETIVERQMELTVQKMQVPEFVETYNMNNEIMYVRDQSETVELKCIVRGVPQPQVTWYLNSTALDFAGRVERIANEEKLMSDSSMKVQNTFVKCSHPATL